MKEQLEPGEEKILNYPNLLLNLVRQGMIALEASRSVGDSHQRFFLTQDVYETLDVLQAEVNKGLQDGTGQGFQEPGGSGEMVTVFTGPGVRPGIV